MSSFTEFLGLVMMTAWIILQMSWFIVIPTMAASYYVGARGGVASIWMLIVTFFAACFLIPFTGETGSGAMVYMALPFVVPLYILPFYGLGQLIGRHLRHKKPVSKEIIEVRDA